MTLVSTSHLPNDCCAVTIRIPRIGEIAIVSIYIPPHSSFHTYTFSYFLHHFSHVIMMGDFNAHHPNINDNEATTNLIGRQLNAAINLFPLQIQNRNGSPHQVTSIYRANRCWI